MTEALRLGDFLWTVPSLVGSTLFVRDREQLMAIDLGANSP